MFSGERKKGETVLFHRYEEMRTCWLRKWNFTLWKENMFILFMFYFMNLPQIYIICREEATVCWCFCSVENTTSLQNLYLQGVPKKIRFKPIFEFLTLGGVFLGVKNNSKNFGNKKNIRLFSKILSKWTLFYSKSSNFLDFFGLGRGVFRGRK